MCGVINATVNSFMVYAMLSKIRHSSLFEIFVTVFQIITFIAHFTARHRAVTGSALFLHFLAKLDYLWYDLT